MGQSKLELAVGTGKWDAGLKKAQQSLNNFTQAQGGLQQALAKDNGDMQKFVQMMAKMDSTANTAKGQMNDYKRSIEQLSAAYNQMSSAQQASIGQDYLKTIDALKQKFQDAKQQCDELSRSLNGINLPDMSGGSGGGLFKGLGDKMSGALQVFAGNMMTKAAGAALEFAGDIGECVKQGIELARQGEGIRIAFERLNQPGLLNNLREATHGTVTDLELMKAAVKFNDFKLPVEELGTMLAFAQQKAKDTGQSVDYMVDSIVTGLGRKSLMILDNLGLSATEVKEKMKETGDMTKAVGEIIREQMSKAGDYVETAADRAAQANVSLQNKMEELGRKFAPLEEASNNLWTSMKIGILDVIGGPLTDLLNKLTQAGRMANAYGLMGGNAKVGRMTANLAGASEQNRQSIYQQQQAQFWKYINPREQQIKDIRAWQSGDRNEALQKRIGAITEKYGSLDATKIQAEVDAAKKMLADYQAAAKQILSPVKADIDTKGAEQNIESLKVKLIELEAQRKKAIAAGDTDLSKNLAKQINQVKSDIKGLGGGRSGGSGGGKSKPTFAPDSIAAQQKLVADLTKQWNKAGAGVRDQYLQPLVEAEAKLKEMQNTMALQKAQAEGKLNGVNLWQGDIDDITGGKRAQFAGTLPDLSKSLQLDNLPLAPLQQLNAELQHLRDILETAPNTEAYQKVLQAIIDKKKQIEQFTTVNIDEGMKDSAKSAQAAASAFNQVGSALTSIEDPSAKVMAIVAQAIATIAQAYANALLSDGTTKSNIWAFIGAAAASIASMTTTISQVHAATGYERGGEIKGNTYSGDQIPIMANAGEIILNRAQAGNLASQLQGNNISNLNLTATIKGEDIRLAINNNGRRTGRGEYVTTRFR